ncbi:NHL repeat-containing protein [Paenibacillus ginsengarvi]|uniref:NHL repeat-containing protein n=1 Tax=Paenibacillus ginsengarvi TaxID=400777 RepID=UPI0013158741|nr:NHL repeat-containing protein [Paenibacillus ginsengarvi]
MRVYKRLALALAAVLATLGIGSPAALAATPYQGYTYNHKFEPVSSLNGYVYTDSIDGFDNEGGPLNKPQDLYIAGDDTLYIADTGNNRIVHLDANKRLLGTYGAAEGSGKLNGPKGVFATPDGDVYVADTKNSRIAVFDKSGKFTKEFRAPESPLLGKDFLYLPSKLIVDKRGYLFIVCDGLYQGLLQLDPDGLFAGFFGANHVPFSMTRVLTNLIATKEQKAQIAGEKPPEFSNLYQDQEGFIYTTTLGIETLQIKRLSAVGVDTLNEQESALGRYGDYRMRVMGEKRKVNSFVDVTVSAQGFITALDLITGRAFQYDSLGNLLFQFGGIGVQNGLFITPSSIAQTSDGTIYVADESRNRIDRFRITAFGELVHKASVLYSDGRYEEAQQPWAEVAKLNSNYNLAYVAIGKSLYKQEKYKEALVYFKQARAYNEYSNAFLEQRKLFLREHFAEAVAIIIAAAVLLRLLLGWRRRRRKRATLVSAAATGRGGAS